MKLFLTVALVHSLETVVHSTTTLQDVATSAMTSRSTSVPSITGSFESTTIAVLRPSASTASAVAFVDKLATTTSPAGMPLTGTPPADTVLTTSLPADGRQTTPPTDQLS